MEYATREQAQNAINTLSNQNLMGRLIYVREVRSPLRLPDVRTLTRQQDRETEPRFQSGGGRGGFDAGRGGRGGYGGGGYGAGPMGGGGRQVFVSNVCQHSSIILALC